MRIVVHCGLPKTGTTTLQESLWSSRAALRQRGVCYPDGLFSPVNAHKAIAPLFIDSSRLWTHLTHDGMRRRSDEELRSRATLAWEHITRQVERERPDVLLLSSETYYNISSVSEAELLRDLLLPLSDDIRFCLYLRHPADRYQSLVREAAKSRAMFISPEPKALRPFLESVEHAFGRPVDLRVYDRGALVDGDIVADFLVGQLHGRVPVEDVPVVYRNESLSTEAAYLLVAFRRHVMPETVGYNVVEPRSLRRVLQAVDRQVPRSSPEALHREVSEAVLRASVDLDWIRERFGVVLPDVQYPVDDGTVWPDLGRFTSIEDVCVVDEERLEVLTARVLDLLLSRASEGVAQHDPGHRTSRIRRTMYRLRRGRWSPARGGNT